MLDAFSFFSLYFVLCLGEKYSCYPEGVQSLGLRTNFGIFLKIELSLTSLPPSPNRVNNVLV